MGDLKVTIDTGDEGMWACIVLELEGACMAIAERAAQWLRASHPAISVAFFEKTVELASTEHDTVELQSMWHVAITNELLFADAEAHRARAFAVLAQ